MRWISRGPVLNIRIVINQSYIEQQIIGNLITNFVPSGFLKSFIIPQKHSMKVLKQIKQFFFCTVTNI